jgi:tRNA (guanine37-N1)-methyltransferase
MRFDVLTGLPEILESPLKTSIIGRAVKKKLADVKVHNLRDYAEGKHKQIDDNPFGGGGGMVLKPEPFFRCIEKLTSQRKYDEIIFLSPQGKKLNQKSANRFSLKQNIMLLCGHYKGIDQRVIDKFVTKEISIGDYVLTGGEIAAVVFIDAVIRLIPGVLGNSESALSDTFQTESVYDAPQYTRPAEFKGMKIPEILLSGNHSEIQKWRHTQGKKKLNKRKK